MEHIIDIKKFNPENLKEIASIEDESQIHFILPLKDERLAVGLGNFGVGYLSVYKIDPEKILVRTIHQKFFDKLINQICELNDGTITITGANNTFKILKLEENNAIELKTVKAKDDSGVIYQVQQLPDGNLITCDDKYILLYNKEGEDYVIYKEYEMTQPCYQMYQFTKNNETSLMICQPNDNKVRWLNSKDLSEYTNNIIDNQDSCKFTQEIAQLDGTYKDYIIVGSVDAIALYNGDKKEHNFTKELLDDSKMLSAFETIPGTDSIIAASHYSENAFKCYILRLDFDGEELLPVSCSKHQVCIDLVRTVRLLKNGWVVTGAADGKIRVLAEE